MVHDPAKHFILIVRMLGREGRWKAIDRLDEGDRFKYTLVTMDDLSNFVRLLVEPTEPCTIVQTAKHLLAWCMTSGVPQLWVSDKASHFKNVVKTELGIARKVGHEFAVASVPARKWIRRKDDARNCLHVEGSLARREARVA